MMKKKLETENRILQSEHILWFYRQLNPSFKVTEGIEIMNPFENKSSWESTKQFYEKFYSDIYRRSLIFGINPGRFGGGITGIPFTDPVRLEKACGIANGFRKVAELSSVFIYEVINAWGGAEEFYRRFFITALSPLGFTKNGINLNYYDDKQLLKDAQQFIVDCIQKQQHYLATEKTCFCLGEGTNYKIFNKLNDEHHFFKKIIPLPHPRWIMQYRRKKMNEYVRLYVDRMGCQL